MMPVVVEMTVLLSFGNCLPNNSAKPINSKKGIEIINRALKWKAPAMSPCNSEWIARCDPHPGQSNPVNVLNGHFGKKRDTDGS